MVSKSSDKIHPVILCGGSGTRLWPLSRKDRPKPFLPLIGKKTLFERAVERASDHERFAPVTVVAGEQHVSLIENQLGDAPEAQLIVDPEGRNHEQNGRCTFSVCRMSDDWKIVAQHFSPLSEEEAEATAE